MTQGLYITPPENLGEVVSLDKAMLQEVTNDESGADKLQGLIFYDDDLQWCRVNGWRVVHGIPLVYYSSDLADNPVDDEHHIYVKELVTVISDSVIVSVYPKYEPSRTIRRSKRDPTCRLFRQVGYQSQFGVSVIGKSTVRQFGAKLGSYDGSIMSDRTIRRILRAQETMFKYGTLVPRNDAEANSSPEAKRWMSGKQLEWLRLQQAATFTFERQ